MTDAELGIELYVVVGNCLGLLVHGIRPTGQPGCDIPQETLQRLGAAVGQLSPDAMLAGVRSLSPAERQDLVRCCRCAMAVAVHEVDTLLGAPESLVEELIASIEAMP